MTDPTIPRFNPGGVKDRIDLRDYQYTEVGFGTAPFDWSKGFDIEAELGTKLPVKDQDGSFSCGGQAWATYAGVLEAAFTGTLEERSAKFIYAQTYQQGGGSTGRDNANIFVNEGVCRETVLSSYMGTAAPSEAFMTRGGDITAESRTDALSDKSFNYSQVEPASIDDIARAIRDNNGVILGITGQNNGTWSSAFPVPPTTNQGLWNHWIYGGKARLFNGKKQVGAFQSWGDGIGEHGWQWLSEDYFKAKVNDLRMVWSAWTHSYSPFLPIPNFNHHFMVDLQQGMMGTEVVALQKALQLDGEFPTTVATTGYFGGITLDAVKKFQVKYHISPVAGYVGSLTRAQLNLLFNH